MYPDQSIAVPHKKASKVKEEAIEALRTGNIKVVNIEREYGLNVYQLQLAGYIPAYVRFETHQGPIQSAEKAEAEWHRLKQRFIKRLIKMLNAEQIYFTEQECVDSEIVPPYRFPSDEYMDGFNQWTNRRQLYCYFPFTPTITLRIPFFLKKV